MNKYSGLEFTGSTYDTFTKAIATPANDIIVAGQLFDYNTPGLIAKFSAKGTPVWAYQYALDFFSFYPPLFFKAIYFTDIVATSDDGYVISGNFDQVISPFGTPPPVKKYALLMKVDRYGKIVWSKTMSNIFGDINFSSVYKTNDGDFIAYLVTDNGEKKLAGDHSYGKVFRFGKDGNIKWASQLFTYFFDAGGLGITHKKGIVQSSNNNIIIADALHKTDPYNLFKIAEGNLHFLELDYATGKVKWERSYEYPVPANDPYYTPDLLQAQQTDDGNYSIISTLYMPSGNTLIKKPVNIIIGNTGKLENIISYTSSASSSIVTDATIINGNNSRSILINTNGSPAVININEQGAINWQKAYDDKSGQFPANCLAGSAKGVDIFMSNYQTKKCRLLITDEVGNIDCASKQTSFSTTNEMLTGPHDSIVTITDVNFDRTIDNGYPMKRTDPYPLIKNVICQDTLACCTDYVDTFNIHNISLCEGSSYMLPDSTVIKDSGVYDITYKTALGCDSITYYKIAVDKNIDQLSAGADTCLTGQASVQLNATSGYGKYYWGNDVQPTGASITINQPGTYYVTVNNTCGMKTDSVTIFEQCEYEVYMPKAFTPNNDGLNDYYRIPPMTKNKLILFRIYNRWGKLVFESRNAGDKWDGSYHNEPLPADAFVYYLEMESFSGKSISQKGSFLLLR